MNGQQAKTESALHWLLAPLTVDEFVREHWEREAAVVRRSSTSIDALHVGPGWFRSFLEGRRLRVDDVRVVQDARAVQLARAHPTDEIAPGAVWHAVESGATVIVDRVDRYWPHFAELRAGLEDALTHPIVMNLYVAGRSSHAFGLHSDGHDVFALQLEGRKVWRFAPRGDHLPLHDDDLKPVPMDAPLREVELGPGDLLYLVRGTPHEASACGALSVHVTIGVHCIRWLDVAKQAVAAWALSSLAARRALPPLGAMEPLPPGFAGVLGELAAQATFQAARERLSAQLLEWGPPSRDALCRARAPIDERAPLRFLRALGARVVEAKDGLYLVVGGGRVRVPAGEEETHRWLAATGRFRLADAPPHLSNVRVVVERLLQMGCLEPA